MKNIFVFICVLFIEVSTCTACLNCYYSLDRKGSLREGYAAREVTHMKVSGISYKTLLKVRNREAFIMDCKSINTDLGSLLSYVNFQLKLEEEVLEVSETLKPNEPPKKKDAEKGTSFGAYWIISILVLLLCTILLFSFGWWRRLKNKKGIRPRC